MAPVARSRPSKRPASLDAGFHSVPMSSRFTKKSFVSTPGRLVKTPFLDWPSLALRTRRPPISTVISGAVKVSSCALSISRCSAGIAGLYLR